MLRGKWWEIYQEPELKLARREIEYFEPEHCPAFEDFMAARASSPAGCDPPTIQPLVLGPSYARTEPLNHNERSSLFERQFRTAILQSSIRRRWVADLWGRVSNTVRQSTNAAQVSAADLENIRGLTEQANLAVFFSNCAARMLWKIFSRRQ